MTWMSLNKRWKYCVFMVYVGMIITKGLFKARNLSRTFGRIEKGGLVTTQSPRELSKKSASSHTTSRPSCRKC